jgi:pimeloyl-ACP methyl ester carboxylesterase
VVVPGLTNDMTKIDSQGEDAFRLFWEASHRDADGDGVYDESNATIAWMGYDAPSGELTTLEGLLDLGGVSRELKAEEGGHLLADFVDGLRATDQGDRSHLTVIGHSYGSTTAAHAAADGLSEDSLVLIGSPGAGGGVDHVSGLDAPAGQVFVGSGDHDPVTWLGRDGDVGMGHDPAQDDFGAVRFPVDSPQFHLEDPGQALTNHTSYFADGSRSLDNLSAIVNGDPPDVVAGRTTEAGDLAGQWAEDEADHQADRAVDAAVDWGRDRVDEAVDVGVDLYEGGVEVYEGGRDWVGDRVESFQDLWP